MGTTAGREAKKPLVQSVERALDVLDLVLDQARPLRSSEIAAHLGLHANTANNLIRTLFRRGYLVQNEDGRYQLGIQCYRLGLGSDRWELLRRAAVPVLQAVAEATGDGAFLAVHSDGKLLCLARCGGTGPVVIAGEQAWLEKYNCTAAGKVLLAYMTQAEQQRVQSTVVLERLTARTTTKWPVLLTEVKRVLKAGYSKCEDEAAVGVSALGVPVVDRQGRFLGALAQSMPTYRLQNGEVNEAQRVDVLRRFAAQLARDYSAVGGGRHEYGQP
ncbi:MAG: hypothetical protein A3K18_32885 [Lentisphaerae bacterium RIFOXYA12_64_32]|nr:MAG: hypothetical protein A3K18_32885 [Lentisphaerae bacterium RIFOXYA12_64_32]